MSDIDSPSFKRLNKGKSVAYVLLFLFSLFLSDPELTIYCSRITYPPTPSPSRAGTNKPSPLTSDGPDSDEYDDGDDDDDDVPLTTSWKGKYRRSAAPSLRASSGA